MCLAIPMRITDLLPDGMALAEQEGVKKEISVSLVPDAAVDDYVIVHVGFALAKVDPAQARATLALMAEIAETGRPQPFGSA